MNDAPPAATGIAEQKATIWRVAAWAMWDWGASAFNVLVTTFVFAVYLTSDAFGEGASTKLALTVAAGGILGALLAPVAGQWADRTGRAGLGVAIATWALAATTAALALIAPQPSYLVPGLALMALGGLFFQVAEVNYNALLARVSTPTTAGKISGLGWGLGYIGGIVILLAAYTLLIKPDTGLFGVSDSGATDIRATMVLCAIWVLIFTAPVIVALRDTRYPQSPVRSTDPTYAPASRRPGVLGAYRNIARTVVDIWRHHRPLAYFMLAAAVYRDGLAGVFTFGAVIAASSFGFNAGEVILFGVAANIIAGVATFIAGVADDRLGSLTLIRASLLGMLLAGAAVFALADHGTIVFWIFGLTLVAFVGPAQNSSRAHLLRNIPAGKEGEVFGLYATTGRALSFLSPTLFAAAIAVGSGVNNTPSDDNQVWGIVGILVVLAAGLTLLTALVRTPQTPSEATETTAPSATTKTTLTATSTTSTTITVTAATEQIPAQTDEKDPRP